MIDDIPKKPHKLSKADAAEVEETKRLSAYYIAEGSLTFINVVLKKANKPLTPAEIWAGGERFGFTGIWTKNHIVSAEHMKDFLSRGNFRKVVKSIGEDGLERYSFREASDITEEPPSPPPKKPETDKQKKAREILSRVHARETEAAPAPKKMPEPKNTPAPQKAAVPKKAKTPKKSAAPKKVVAPKKTVALNTAPTPENAPTAPESAPPLETPMPETPVKSAEPIPAPVATPAPSPLPPASPANDVQPINLFGPTASSATQGENTPTREVAAPTGSAPTAAPTLPPTSNPNRVKLSYSAVHTVVKIILGLYLEKNEKARAQLANIFSAKWCAEHLGLDKPLLRQTHAGDDVSPLEADYSQFDEHTYRLVYILRDQRQMNYEMFIRWAAAAGATRNGLSNIFRRRPYFKMEKSVVPSPDVLSAQMPPPDLLARREDAPNAVRAPSAESAPDNA